jgi:hypothetical protein
MDGRTREQGQGLLRQQLVLQEPGQEQQALVRGPQVVGVEARCRFPPESPLAGQGMWWLQQGIQRQDHASFAE